MRNDKLLNHRVNKPFDDILIMSQQEFKSWCRELRTVIVKLWDEEDLPPRVGFTEKQCIEQFEKMITFPIRTLEIDKDVIRNTSVIGNAVNDWFPTMMKTRISYSSVGKARSIYDYFADDDLFETFVTYASRHFKRDSFYHYSAPISKGEILELGGAPYQVTTAEEFRDWFKNNTTNYGYWLCGVKDTHAYSGYNVELGKRRNLFVDADFDCPEICKTNVDQSKWNKYSIRVYKKGQKIFPLGLKAFRVSFCQYAVNFPPLTARYLYERFTEHIPKDQRVVIYDPSMGWGGRLLGAMAVDNARDIHYVGTDPNTDHDIAIDKTKYHDIAEFFNDHVRHSGKLFAKSHTYDFFQKGSEVISQEPKFQKYKGKLDLVFTSPPYFSKEVYSDDAEQSCHKFGDYEDWRENFLKPTLTTCVEYLKKDRFLLWNIADIVLAGKMLPLEEDSCAILRALGMEYVTTLKMTLAQMPGGNRLVQTDEIEIVSTSTIYGEVSEEIPIVKGKMKNYIQVKSKGKSLMLKYEPIFVFRKP